MAWFSESHSWRSGPWSLSLRSDEFADISFEGRRVLRSARAVIRDRNWDTASLIVDHVRETGDTLSLHVRSEGLGSSFRGIVRVEARPGALEILCDLESEAPFETNRTGLVVLNPPHLAGSPLRVTHPDGAIDETVFPLDLSPHQPVLDIVALSWFDADTEIAVTFEGDVFEMEDQRNWTDASFKTYSRPLSLPFPYSVAAGERVRQKISIRAERLETQMTTVTAPARIVLSGGGPFPEIVLAAATAPDPAPGFEPLGAAVLVELDLSSTNWRSALERARSAALPLDVRFILAPEDHTSLREGVEALRGLDVARVAAFQQASDARHVSDEEAIRALRDALAETELSPRVVGGSRSHFTELNRELHRVPPRLDGLTVTVTPLFHATDTEQLVESVAMQRLVALQTRTYARGLPVHIGPVYLRPRFNNVATGPQPGPQRADLAEGYGAEFTGTVDERQWAPELAAWTIASAAALAVPGVASLAWFEEWGERGIRSSSGEAFPVFAALEALATLRGELLWGDSPDGSVWAIGARDLDATVYVANLARDERTIDIEASDGLVTVTVPASSFRRLEFPRADGPMRADPPGTTSS